MRGYLRETLLKTTKKERMMKICQMVTEERKEKKKKRILVSVMQISLEMRLKIKRKEIEKMETRMMIIWPAIKN